MLTDVTSTCVALTVVVSVRKKFVKSRHRWMKEWFKKREEEYPHENLLNDLRITEVEDYRLFLRVDVPAFEELLAMAKPRN